MTRKPKEPTSLQRAQKAHAARMREKGFKAKTFWLSEPGAEALATIKGKDDSDSDAINAALIAATRKLSPSQGLKGDGSPPHKAAQNPADPSKAAAQRKTPEKGSSGAVSKTAGRSDPLASVPLGPQPFKSRLKGTK